MKSCFFKFPVTFILLAIATVAIISATFIEAASSTEAARRWVYDAVWFEVVLGLLTINVVGSLFKHRSFSWNKISVPLFHLSFVLVMLGAVFTRYTGVEGTINIREGEKSGTVLTYNDHSIQLPFEIYLHDFELKRYPGSNSPSSYSSYVKVYDAQKQKNFDFHIYMNHILKYRGWRFFQTSYDKDEKGTFLTASRDVIGTPLTYAGYFLMIVTMLLSLFMPGTFFRKQLAKLGQMAMLIAVLVLPIAGFSAEKIDNSKVVSASEAKLFGELVVQDYKGRMKTLNTLNNEFMRKLYGKKKMENLNADQVVLSMLAYPDYWKNVPIIKVSNKEVRMLLGMEGKYLSYEKLFHPQSGQYILNEPVSQSFMKAERNRGKKDKAFIQLDDEANLLHMFIKGDALTVFPISGAENNKWYSASNAARMSKTTEDSLFLENIVPMYLSELIDGNSTQAGQYLKAIKKYQQTIGTEVMLTDKKVKAELLYNSLNIFEKVQHFFGLAGFVLLIIVFVGMFRGKKFKPSMYWVFWGISLLLVLATSFGFFLRWYISGYMPVSNSLEVMIFLAIVVTLAGMFISKRQPIVLALSLILAYTFFMVAGMNSANPEIGNLVPVLKSYWLSIHVAVITSSYALFALVMMVAFINLMLYLFSSENNFEAMVARTENLAVLNQIMLTIGLYLLTIGTILGAIWANESWGRYWGWDSKETWALISILVYSFVAHMRFIPKMNDGFWFNLASFWAFSSILMTFFGVNYLLSGLHSYAGVGAAKMPAWILYTTAVLVIITALSGVKYFMYSRPKK